MRPLRILIADDHDLMRRGLRGVLESRPGWTICAECPNGREAVAKAEALRPDVVILDIGMPDLNGIEAARRILKQVPHPEILLLSAHYTDQLIRDVLAIGIRGYILKSDAERELVTAVESLINRKAFFTSQATELMLAGFGDTRDLPKTLRSRLTCREAEIVQLLAEGKSSKEVASELNISTKTAETHRANIMRKLEIHSISELVRYAVRNQIVQA